MDFMDDNNKNNNNDRFLDDFWSQKKKKKEWKIPPLLNNAQMIFNRKILGKRKEGTGAAPWCSG